MTNIIYSDEQILMLSNNPYIHTCSAKYITFTPECKKEAVRLYDHEWLSPKRAFETLGFPDFMVQSTFPKDSIKRWRKIAKARWIEWLHGKKRGRKKKERSIEDMTPKDRMEYLEAKVAYLEQENNFLRLLRAKKK